LAKLVEAGFLPDGRRIVTSDEQGHAWIWKLPVDQRPADDLARLARVLAGDATTSSGGSAAPPSESLGTIWQQLLTKYPSDFTTSDQEIATWHEFEADDSE